MEHKILIVDGHPVYILKLVGFLEGLTFKNIFLATSGQEGINKTELINPDLVILSGMLPDMESKEVCKEIKAFNNKIKIIVQTGLFTDSESMKAFRTVGADAVLARKEKDLMPLQGIIEEFIRVPQ